MTELYSDGFITSLTAAVTTTSRPVTLSVAATSPDLAGGTFSIIIYDVGTEAAPAHAEILEVADGTTTTWSANTESGHTPITHANGSTVRLVLTKRSLTQQMVDHTTIATTPDPHTQYIRKGNFVSKGDVLVGTGSGFAVQNVGVDGQSIIADSTQPTGVRWGTVAASILAHMGDLLLGAYRGTASRLGIGTPGQVLAVVQNGPAIANPVSAPTCAANATTGGTLTNGVAYDFAYAWSNGTSPDGGTTLVSPRATFTATTTGRVDVTAPAAPSSGLTLIIYSCHTGGTLNSQGTITNASTSTTNTFTVSSVIFGDLVATANLTGGITASWGSPWTQSSTAAVIATAGTISTSGVTTARVVPSAAVTGVILQAGTIAGQILTVVNEAASANSVTFAASGTSNVADGTNCVVPGLTQKLFVWDASTSLWYEQTSPSATVMGASGGSHAAGLVPDPGSTAGTTHFLREDASWATVFSQSSSAAATTTGGTITTSGVTAARVAPTAAVTGVILQVGTYGGQVVAVVNEATAANSVTFAASGTSNVADGTTCVIAGLTQRVFVWDAGTSLWYEEAGGAVMGASGSGHASGLVPDPGSTAGTTRFLREDATFFVPPTMVASGGSHAAGYAPDPGSTAGTTHFLREDATWRVPPTMGASGGSHAAGYAPDPGSTAGTTHFLREDASWATVNTESSSTATLSNGSTITTSGVTTARVTSLSNVTGIILQSGTFPGQVVNVINEGGNRITFDVELTSGVTTGTGCTILGGYHKTFTWDSGTFFWYEDVPTMVASGVAHAPGLVPDPPSSFGSTHFLREDASWSIPPSMVASGGSHAPGYAPDPGSTAGTTRYLREDATWVNPLSQSSSAAATGTGGTITTSGVTTARVSPTGAVTGVILQSGTFGGQVVTVINEAVAANSVTFDVSGTSHVADGVSAVIPGLTQRTFVWDAGTSLWYEQPGTSVSVMGASGSSHAAGLAPDPGSTAGTTRYLREDATWDVPPGGGGGSGGTGGSGIPVANSVGTDVTMTSANTYYDGPSVSVAAGTWVLTGSVTVTNTSASSFTAKLWDGTTVLDSAEQNISASGFADIALSATVSPSSSATYKISVACTSASGTIKAAAPDNGAGNNASTLTALPVFGYAQSSTATAVTSSGTITTVGVTTARVSPASAVTGVILQAGTYGGQILTVLNEAISANSVTFAASGTSNVADGTAAVIPGLTQRSFIWDASTSLWYEESSSSATVMGASGGSHAAGLAPDPGSTAGTTHFLREDASWSIPPTMVASGGSHAAGYAPDPGSTSGTTRYLREDASWQNPYTQSGSAAATGNSGTITTSGVTAARVSPTGAVTGVILQAGTFGGQVVSVVNEAVAANSVTFAAAGTSNVADGTACIIPGLTQRTFVWDAGTSLWYEQPGASTPVMGASGGSHAAGLAPDPGSTAGTTHFLREDATWVVPPTMVASGGSHAPGYAPDPGSTAGTTHFLREDATWQNLTSQSGSAAATATGGTITTSGVTAARVSPTGAITGVILQAGTLGGQVVTVINEAVAANTVTFAAAGTSNVADGTSAVIPGLTQRTFVWDTATSLWYEQAGGSSSVMVASGSSHAAGLAPDPGSAAGTTHFLREDATWAVPPDVGGTLFLARNCI